MTIEMYPGMVNSPITALVSGIDAETTTIEVTDASKLPAGPNIAVIGRGEGAETILYTAKSGNILTGVTRGFQGTARAWPYATEVARYFTAYDYDALRQNLIVHKAEDVSYFSAEFSRDMSLTGDQIISGFPFVPELVVIDSIVHNSAKVSFGKSDGSSHFVIYTAADTKSWLRGLSFAIRIAEGTSVATNGAVTINSDKTITINWSHTGGGATGTASFKVTAFKHGGARQ